MRKPKMAKSRMDGAITEIADKAEHEILATWAADCAERVLPLFEKERPGDDRPRKAVKAVSEWVQTGVFKMSDVRGASLAAHSAAREVAENDAARSAARAAGQAMATAHVPRHALAAAIYAATAVRDSVDPSEADSAMNREREWQYRRLLDLSSHKGSKKAA